MNVQDQIRARIATFSLELEALVRSAAIEAVRASLGGDERTARPIAPRQKAPSAPSRVKSKRAKGAKRTPEQLARVDAAILGHVKSHAGTRIEEIAQDLGVSTHELKLRVALLVAGKKLKKTGVKRATKYSIA